MLQRARSLHTKIQMQCFEGGVNPSLLATPHGRVPIRIPTTACSGGQSGCGMSAPLFSNRVSSIANRFDSQVRPAGASDCQSSLGRLRILFLQSNLMQEICCCSCVCGVWARIRAWQRVRARPHAHRLPSERLEIHQRTCSPALPDLRAAPLTDLGQCRRRPSAARMQGPGRAAGKRAPASPEGASILPRHSRMLFLGS